MDGWVERIMQRNVVRGRCEEKGVGLGSRWGGVKKLGLGFNFFFHTPLIPKNKIPFQTVIKEKRQRK